MIAGFSLVGIALGVGTLIAVMSVMTGFRVELLRQITSVNGQLAVQPYAGATPSYARIARDIRGVPGVADAVPTVEGQGLAQAGGEVRGVVVRGLRAEDLGRKSALVRTIAGPEQERAQARALCRPSDGVEAPGFDWGGVEGFGDGGALIGRRMAEAMRLKVGDRFFLMSPKEQVSPIGVVPRSALVRVVGIYCVGMHDYDANFVFVPMATAQSLFDLGDSATLVEVFLADPERYPEYRRLVADRVGRDGYVFDWVEANASFFQIVQEQTAGMFLVLTLIVVVAAFNIVSSMMMLVRTKTADIAILRTMGAGRGAVLRMFLLTGASIGVAGTALGAALGALFAVNIEAIRRWLQDAFGLTLFDPALYQLAELPVRLAPGEIAGICAMAFAAALAATLYPAWKAARLEPIEGLRRE